MAGVLLLTGFPEDEGDSNCLLHITVLLLLYKIQHEAQIEVPGSTVGRQKHQLSVAVGTHTQPSKGGTCVSTQLPRWPRTEANVHLGEKLQRGNSDSEEREIVIVHILQVSMRIIEENTCESHTSKMFTTSETFGGGCSLILLRL